MRALKKVWLVSILGLLASACNDAEEELVEDDVIAVCPSEPPSDAIDVESLEIVDGELRVEVYYSGGCEEHIVNACWDEGFAEGDPMQVRVWLRHHAMGDLCKAGIWTSRVFELGAIEQSWAEAYPDQDGVVEVWVGGESIVYEF